MSAVIDDHIKWRFVNPDDYAERLRAIDAGAAERATLEAETVDGRTIEHSSSSVHDSAGTVVGRVIMLHDVTSARTALADARRLAQERAALLEREERRAQEEVVADPGGARDGLGADARGHPRAAAGGEHGPAAGLREGGGPHGGPARRWCCRRPPAASRRRRCGR